MEHKLIQGGESYLAFARSRIKALRATGMRYATQRFVMPGGEQVMVRLSGDHDYIEIRGGSSAITMDSGVVEIFAIAPLNVQRYDAGVLYESGAAASYNASFLAVEGKTYRARATGSPASSAGQLAGMIARLGGHFSGKIFPTQCFAPQQIEDPLDATAKIPDPADDLLLQKKTMAVTCPASIFTGRCRMYVQAMYGRPLRTGSAETLALRLESESAPSLRVPAFKIATGFPAYVVLDTSCGILFETTTLHHYLVKPTGTAFTFYPLVATSNAEAMRRFLDPTGDADSDMSDTDREHLEAYILAHSLPDTRYAVTGDGGYAFGNYSMGYGWHWNWSGYTADIVINNTYVQDSLHQAMESTHYRVTVVAAESPDTPDTPFTFTTPVAVIEGPERWAVYRPSWTIVEPNYADYVLEKTTPQLSNLFECSAPFYAFYDRDELKVCRVDVSITLGDGATVEEVNVYGAALNTTGTQEGTRTEYSASGAYHKAVFSCGDVTTGNLPYAQVRPFSARNSVQDKALRGDWTAGFGSDIYAARDYPRSENDGSNYRVETIGGWLLTDRQGGYMTYNVFGTAGSEETDGYAQIIVPFNDSEAVFIRGSTTRVTTAITKSQYQMLSFQHIIRSIVGTAYSPYGDDQVAAQYAVSVGSLAASGPTLVSLTALGGETVTDELSLTEKLVGHGASKDVTFDNIAQFMNNTVDQVDPGYSVLASFPSVSGTGPITISANHVEPSEGMDGVDPAIPVIVGWA